MGDGTVPLQRAGEFLALVGQAMHAAIHALPTAKNLPLLEFLIHELKIADVVRMVGHVPREHIGEFTNLRIWWY